MVDQTSRSEGATQDNFDLEKSHVLPALIRKIHLGKCLEDNNWDAIRQDLNKRPIECVSGTNSIENILTILNKYGISSDRLRNSQSEPESQPDSQPHSSVSVEIWGSGAPMREFLWSEEMAEACVFVMENVNFSDLTSQTKPQPQPCNTHINIGIGKEISIKDLAYLVKSTIGYTGEIFFNTEKPDGTMRKLTDPSKLHKLGWKHKIEINDGISKIFSWYLIHNN